MNASVGWALIGMASAVWIATAIAACLANARSNHWLWTAGLGVGAAAVLSAGISGLTHASSVELAFPAIGLFAFQLRLDGLAGWFLIILGTAALPVLLYLRSYMSHLVERVDMRLFWAALALLCLSMSTVILSRNVITFLVAWETMSLSSFLLVATDHRQSSVRQAALLYLGATRAGSTFLMAGMLWAGSIAGSWEFSNWHLSGAQALGPGLLILIGLCVKAGSWPFHLWLPAAHPAAPAPVSALLSGVMVKVAIYMIARLFVVSPAFTHPAFGYALALLGAVSAFWGVLFALLQNDLKRLLAYSTVENVGLILLALGIGLIAKAGGLPLIPLAAFAAALFHALNHALFKSLLFLGAGAVDVSGGTRDLDRLGGLGQRMRITYACFVAGSAAICALPPLNGFASEWLLYRSALAGAAFHPSAAMRFVLMLSIGWIALVGALALGCFVRAVGVAFQGRPRSHAAERSREVSGSMTAAQIIVALACGILGLYAPAVIRVLGPIVTGSGSGRSLDVLWTLPTGGMVVIMVLTIGTIFAWMRAMEVTRPPRKFITWECGFGSLTPRMQVAGASFSQPIARMFGLLYRYAVKSDIAGENRRLFPEEIAVEPTTISYLESKVYSPSLKLVNRLGGLIQRLQAGSIHLYLLMMFGTLIVLLVLVRWIR